MISRSSPRLVLVGVLAVLLALCAASLVPAGHSAFVRATVSHDQLAVLDGGGAPVSDVGPLAGPGRSRLLAGSVEPVAGATHPRLRRRRPAMLTLDAVAEAAPATDSSSTPRERRVVIQLRRHSIRIRAPARAPSLPHAFRYARPLRAPPAASPSA